MAKFEKTINGDFDEILNRIQTGIMNGSMTATFEDGSEYRTDLAKCAVRVFERYSAIGGNRVSLNVTLFGIKDIVHVSAITSGGSQGMLFKLNTFGEEAFLDKIIEILG